jgi:subtilase family serine protease
MVPSVPKVRIIVISAGVAALAAAALAAVLPASAAPFRAAGHAATGQAAAGQPASAAMTAEVRPDFTRIPGVARQSPPTTGECEQSLHIACYTPAQMRAAYQLPTLYGRGITGRGETIVIEESYGSPTIRADLQTFDRQFGYPNPPKFSVIQPIGKVAKFNPKNANMTGWQYETSLDVEYAHAVAPGASIVVAETPATGSGSTQRQVMEAEEYVVNHHLGAMISESFSGTEAGYRSAAQLQPLRAGILDAYRHHVSILASSGDAGATTVAFSGSGYYDRREVDWQASDPLVTAVGGTKLIESGGRYTSAAWNDTYNTAVSRDWFGSTRAIPAATGGGKSALFGRPSYQNGVKSLTGVSRGVPDIAMSAACSGAVIVYSSHQPGEPGRAGWSEACGTSESAPEFAGIVALADQVAGRWLGLVNPTLYKLVAEHAPGLVNVTAGNNTVSFYGGRPVKRYTVTGYNARKGYSLVTGVGTVNASLFVYELAGKKP